jgi:hypothetical protein
MNPNPTGATQPEQKPKTPSAGPALDSDNAYVLYVNPSQAFVRPLLGPVKAKAVTELRIARLNERTLVAAIIQNAAGIHTLTEPVRAGDHWIREGEDGRVDDLTFIRALAKLCLPWHVKFRRENEDDLGTLRLGEC